MQCSVQKNSVNTTYCSNTLGMRHHNSAYFLFMAAKSATDSCHLLSVQFMVIVLIMANSAMVGFAIAAGSLITGRAYQYNNQ